MSNRLKSQISNLLSALGANEPTARPSLPAAAPRRRRVEARSMSNLLSTTNGRGCRTPPCPPQPQGEGGSSSEVPSMSDSALKSQISNLLSALGANEPTARLSLPFSPVGQTFLPALSERSRSVAKVLSLPKGGDPACPERSRRVCPSHELRVTNYESRPSLEVSNV